MIDLTGYLIVGASAAVATAGGSADLALVDQHHVAGRVAFLGNDGRPETGVAAADDAQVAMLVADECRIRLREVGTLEPIGIRLGV